MKKVPKTDSLYIDIGCKDKESAQKLVNPGDIMGFEPGWTAYGQGFVMSKALDDRVGCAVMLQLIEEELPMDCTFVFSAQEEVGTRGAFGAAFSVTPEIALVLEGTTAADLPGTDEHRRVAVPGKGPVLSFMDNGTIYDRGLFELLRDLADRYGIPWQTKNYVSGGNDSSAIQRTKEGVRVAAVSTPVRYLHAPSGVACVQDISHVHTLVKHFIEALAAS